MIYIKAYTHFNLGDDLLIKLICDHNKQYQFCILADEHYKELFKDVKNLVVKSEEYKLLQEYKSDFNSYNKVHNKILNEINKTCDTFLYVGGSIFMESGKTSLDMLKQLKKELFYFKKRYIVNANFGPFQTKEYFDFVHDEIIPLLNRVSFRDKYSYNLFKDLNNVIYAPDLVFSLDYPKKEKTKSIGISLIHHLERENLKRYYEDYLDTLIILVKRYIKLGYDIHLLSFCEYEKDTLAIEMFMNKLSVKEQTQITIDYYYDNINVFLDVLSGLDIIIATRFHSVVLGLNFNCKIIPVLYSDKTLNLLEDLNIPGRFRFNNVIDIIDVEPYRVELKTIDIARKNSFNHYDYK